MPLRHPYGSPARGQARGPGLREAAMTIINRREALSGAGALVVSVTLPGVKARAAANATRIPLKGDQLSTYISINADGSAVGWIGKVDMGQGTTIGWIKMIAEELDLP